MTLLAQLVTMLPMLLAYVAGLVVCALMWRRAPVAAGLAMAGTALMLAASVVGTVLQSYLIQTRATGATAAQLSTVLTVIGIGRMIVHAGGFVLVLVAVFAQRQGMRSGFEVQMAGRAEEMSS
jgi:hypothetical protein